MKPRKWDLTLNRPLEKKFEMPQVFESYTDLKTGRYYVGIADLDSGDNDDRDHNEFQDVSLIDYLPARLKKTIAADEFSDAYTTLDLDALAAEPGVDGWALKAIQAFHDGLSERAAIQSQPDQRSQRKMQAAFRRLRANGLGPFCQGICAAVNPSIADGLARDGYQINSERARALYVLGAVTAPAKLSELPRLKPTTFFEAPAKRRAVYVPIPFEERYPAQARAGDMKSCPLCQLLIRLRFFTRHTTSCDRLNR